MFYYKAKDARGRKRRTKISNLRFLSDKLKKRVKFMSRLFASSERNSTIMGSIHNKHYDFRQSRRSKTPQKRRY